MFDQIFEGFAEPIMELEPAEVNGEKVRLRPLRPGWCTCTYQYQSQRAGATPVSAGGLGPDVLPDLQEEEGMPTQPDKPPTHTRLRPAAVFSGTA